MNAEPRNELIERAIALAARLQKRANELQTPAERRQQMELDRMCQSPEDKATLVQLTDQAFRSQRASRVAKQFTHILDVQGIPRFCSSLDRTMLRGFQTFGDWLPSVTVPLVKEHMRQETANVVLPAETQHLTTHLRARKPAMPLFAETGGKNASIITALSDRELALKHVVYSAFSHAGQKSSATSLLLLEREVYEDANFKRMLIDAVRSIRCGSAWELQSRMGPMIRPPGGDLERAMKTLEPGESWAVMPHQIGDNAALRSPGVKWGVSRGSFTHLTEFFGPVLAVIAFDTLDEAIDIVNETGYGLTSGIHSLDEREIARWREGVHAGNLYINRSAVRAVVLRQPFGGMRRSCFGPGIKAGGPNNVAQLMRFENRTTKPPQDTKPTNPALALLAEALTHADPPVLDFRAPQLLTALLSYDACWLNEFSREHDHLRLLGQDNIRRYLRFARQCSIHSPPRGRDPRYLSGGRKRACRGSHRASLVSARAEHQS